MPHPPFHEGEIALQERSGERATAIRNGAMISRAIPPGARPFLAQQRMLAAAALDARGQPWAALLFGAPGLAATADGRIVSLDRSRVAPAPSEPPWSDLRPGAPLGLLAIDLGSRRRLRVNGVVSSLSQEAVELEVAEAYPNCPKYIQRRRLVEAGGPPAEAGLASGASLDAPRQAVAEKADTMFVASRHPERGLDVSHRGGAAGFLRVLDDRTLRVPDYPGNGMFSTLGNLAVSPGAALLVPDFVRGRILQLAGRASLGFEAEEDPRYPTGGTLRHWDFHVERWIESPAPARFRWELLEASPFNPIPRADGSRRSG